MAAAGSGAGPAEHRQYVGSEGIYGIITEVSLRVLQLEKTQRRAKATVLFPTAAHAATDGGDPAHAATDAAFVAGARCVRRLAQSGLLPANLRLIDGPEAAMTTPGWAVGFATGTLATPPPSAMLLIGFEGQPDTDVDAQMRQALAICAEEGGESPAIDAWRQDPAAAVFSRS